MESRWVWGISACMPTTFLILPWIQTKKIDKPEHPKAIQSPVQLMETEAILWSEILKRESLNKQTCAFMPCVIKLQMWGLLPVFKQVLWLLNFCITVTSKTSHKFLPCYTQNHQTGNSASFRMKTEHPHTRVKLPMFKKKKYFLSREIMHSLASYSDGKYFFFLT